MPSPEFELIQRYFSRHDAAPEIVLGIGDDCALARVPAGMELAMTVDTMVEGVHFPRHTAPFDIGYKALAVNLSDLASMGARPAWFTLALTLPRNDPDWLAGFSEGLHALAGEHRIALVGGDTTRGPLSITIQAHGLVPAGEALLRRGARAGDLVAVSGTPGDAGLGLQLALGQRTTAVNADYLRARLDRPSPRVALGQRLRGIASACIDVSDGIAADLGHLLEASGVGADIELARLPLSEAFRQTFAGSPDWNLALTAGDDFELLFTVPPAREADLAALADVTVIGRIGADQGARFHLPQGGLMQLEQAGYDHFRSAP